MVAEKVGAFSVPLLLFADRTEVILEILSDLVAFCVSGYAYFHNAGAEPGTNVVHDMDGLEGALLLLYRSS